MKDKNGNSVGIFSTVRMIGDKHDWTVIESDGFGGLNIKCNVTGRTLSRHPSTLILKFNRREIDAIQR